MVSILVEVVATGQTAGFGMAPDLERFLRLDSRYEPVPMPAVRSPLRSRTFGMAVQEQDCMVLRAEIESTEQVEELGQLDDVVAVWSDPMIEPIIDCTPASAKGGRADVVRALNADKVWQATGVEGDDIIIGVVDGGVDGSKYPVVGGWSPDPGSPHGDWNVAWNEHGNMCAFDALAAAPKATLFDYGIGKTSGGVPALLSSALSSFQHAISEKRSGGPAPAVLTNSWGLYQQSWDPFPPGHASNYTHNLAHPFNRKVIEAMDEGIVVVFAAGNCGAVCADSRCGPDSGPGRSIRGANGMERVICVGAVNINDEWIGYSSQGPSTLAEEKPDVCGFSHFKGHFSSDSGTSAACPVVAGVVALLLSAGGVQDQSRIRQTLKDSSRQRGSNVWNDRFGYGIVDAEAAWRAL